MKLTRNKIRKIRKQQHQSVRKWKKPRNSIRRKVSTFRQTPLDLVPKRTNVFNKTLKNYIPLPVLCYLKQKYIEVKRLRRKQRKQQRMNMIGGGERAETLALAAVATAKAKANPNNGPKSDSTNKNPAAADVSNEDGENAKKDENATGDDVTTTGKDTNDAAPAAPGEDAKEKGADGKTDGDKGDKKPGSFSLGPEVPGDVSINSETHEFKDVKRLLDFLVKKGLPYYIQIELKRGIPLNLKETDIFDLRRILYGKFVKGGDKTDLHFKPGGDYVGIANGSILTNEYPNDVFIFTKDKVNIDKSSEDTSVKVKAGEKMIPPLSDSKRLYKLSGDTPSSIDDLEQIDKVAITSTDEFRLQVAPLSDADLKNAAAAAPSDDKKKKKKIVSDDTPSYVVNLNEKCKITSVQTLRKSLEVVRADLEDEDEVSKSNAMEIFKLLISLLNNPAFAKNDGFDDFKETVYGFTYKIPGTERKYGFIQLMSFFDQKKDDLPPDLTKQFFKLLTLLGHGPAGENGACLAFERPQSIEVIEYVKTLENGDIVTTKKLGSKTNMEGFGSELDKLNATNAPKEEDEKKDEKKDEAAGDEAGGKEGESAKTEKPAPAPAAEAAPAAPVPEPTPAPAPEPATAAEPAPVPEPEPEAKNSMMAEEIKAQEASAVAVASIALSEAQANMNNQPTDRILLKDIPKEPIQPSEEVKAINELYKDDKTRRKSKIDKILSLKKNFNEKLNKVVTLLRDIFKNSINSKSNSTNKKNMYLGTSGYKGKIAELEGLVEEIKDDPDYKIIKDYPDKITSELKISKLWKDDNEKNLLAKIDKLFYIYWNIWQSFNSAYDYFRKYKDMTDNMVAFKDSALDIGDRFRKELTNMEKYIVDLTKDASDTEILEQQLMASK